jgi:two-component system cell cycle sensor histidine kinase/response regulator CckA
VTLPDNRPPLGGTAAAHARTVLVVDDEDTVRRFTARVLTSDGYQVHEAADGLAALALLRSGTELVDCVVSDIVMPRLDGVRLLEEISREVPGLPVILMSAYGAAQLADRGIAAPCAVLHKPFAPDRLLEEVRRCLASRL